MDDLNSMQVVLNWGRSWRLHIEFSDNYHVPDCSFIRACRFDFPLQGLRRI
ncbi:hypothetical protein WG66_010006 [Moniliophthora roreri]|nr:hypothetical protein WG66_010006 [Moniliophthora roreri]